MAQTWRVKAERNRKPRPPLDEGGLERIALFYAGRYATTRAKLDAYLRRKLKERGWGGAGEPPVARLTERFVALGYVDDRAFAAARAASLGRRGYGERRVVQALHAAGIEAADAAPALERTRAEAMAAALRFAQKRRLGPYALEAHDWDTRRNAAAAMLRAGHGFDVVRRILDAPPGELIDPDIP
ncbi:MAG: regulatory protein [Sphingomonadales bacterium]|jgi:regulatory protein|nr:regulatory protein [Sphingomonadales bacterium]